MHTETGSTCSYKLHQSLSRMTGHLSTLPGSIAGAPPRLPGLVHQTGSHQWPVHPGRFQGADVQHQGCSVVRPSSVRPCFGPCQVQTLFRKLGINLDGINAEELWDPEATKAVATLSILCPRSYRLWRRGHSGCRPERLHRRRGVRQRLAPGLKLRHLRPQGEGPQLWFCQKGAV